MAGTRHFSDDPPNSGSAFLSSAFVFPRSIVLAVALGAVALPLAPAPAAQAASPAPQYGVNVHFEQPMVNYVGTYDPSTYNRVLDLMKSGGTSAASRSRSWRRSSRREVNSAGART